MTVAKTPGVLLDVAGAATLLGTTPKAIRAHVARRTLPFRRLGSRIVFVRTELEQFLEALDGCDVAEALTNAAARDGKQADAKAGHP